MWMLLHASRRSGRTRGAGGASRAPCVPFEVAGTSWKLYAAMGYPKTFTESGRQRIS
jgi:hypothetical protein